MRFLLPKVIVPSLFALAVALPTVAGEREVGNGGDYDEISFFSRAWAAYSAGFEDQSELTHLPMALQKTRVVFDDSPRSDRVDFLRNHSVIRANRSHWRSLSRDEQASLSVRALLRSVDIWTTRAFTLPPVDRRDSKNLPGPSHDNCHPLSLTEPESLDTVVCEIVNILFKTQESIQVLGHFWITKDDFIGRSRRLQFSLVPKRPIVKLNGLDAPRDARNFESPEGSRIEVYKDSWTHASPGEKRVLVFHEILGLMGIEATHYPLCLKHFDALTE